LSIDLTRRKKSDSVRKFHRNILDRLVAAQFCPPPKPEDDGEVILEGPQWAEKLDVFATVLREAAK